MDDAEDSVVCGADVEVVVGDVVAGACVVVVIAADVWITDALEITWISSTVSLGGSVVTVSGIVTLTTSVVVNVSAVWIGSELSGTSVVSSVSFSSITACISAAEYGRVTKADIL